MEIEKLAQNIDDNKGDKDKRNKWQSLYFIDPKTFLNIISDKRLTILYTLRSHGKTDIHNLSNTLRRNYNDVYHDVQLLKQAGLIKQSISEAISVPWDIIQTEIKLTAL